MGPALISDGILIFLSLLVLLLATMLYAVMRMPSRAYSVPVPEDQSGTVVPARPAAVRLTPARPAPVPGGPARPPVSVRQPAGSAGGTSGRTKYAARHVAGPEPDRATIGASTVSGTPPWDPAPRPPSQRS
jgi:hypothetical protein